MTFGSFLSQFRSPKYFAPTTTSGRRAGLTLPFFSRTNLNLSVLPLCSLCLCGGSLLEKNHHKGTESTEVAQRIEIQTTPNTLQENS
jgi:hypothetical protein